MEKRLALIGIIVSNRESTKKLNDILHEYGSIILGRMGVPYREQGIHVISIIVDAPQDTISALSGKLGMIPDISTKTIYPAVPK
ncbi:MAG: iron-only hydrogenase system regulator [Megasphaera sp.]|jgi:putative iron-only hydrogenase system regulator|nr:iron-only hydrogenase system regulator [Megasphaera sp.]MCI1247821.1 iron-only hydrogenase system regulator [Megasphaera sp.]